MTSILLHPCAETRYTTNYDAHKKKPHRKQFTPGWWHANLVPPSTHACDVVAPVDQLRRCVARRTSVTCGFDVCRRRRGCDRIFDVVDVAIVVLAGDGGQVSWKRQCASTLLRTWQRPLLVGSRIRFDAICVHCRLADSARRRNVVVFETDAAPTPMLKLPSQLSCAAHAVLHTRVSVDWKWLFVAGCFTQRAVCRVTIWTDDKGCAFWHSVHPTPGENHYHRDDYHEE